MMLKKLEASRQNPLQQMQDWTGLVSEVAGLDAEARNFLRQRCRVVTAPAGACVFGEGGPCQDYLILISGRMRVQKLAENGREITLYRVEPGETCVVTTVCLMSDTSYDAEGIAETDITAQALPMAPFRELLARSAAFRDFVFRAYGTRICDLLMLIEEVSFGRIDQRLAACLVERGREGKAIPATHQELAFELGTAREVVSRQLKEFERRGWLKLSRGSVLIAEPGALKALAQKRLAESD